ncbi:hypothetical protein [Arsukibacterium perlucidum]|uniref:hypothetical protein n=1 Tax=Arsukibacterium perlucidum TaxID=368811 RepID=UPI0003631023|nr:hypothetical protein [Arsukibacterium perlucidum]
MKIAVLTISLVVLLSGCDSANQMLDKAQETANQKVESLQNKIENFDIESFNSELFKSAPELVSQLNAAVNDALNADLSNIAEVNRLKTSIKNVYSCLVAASSADTAQDVMQKLLANITNAEIRQLIESGIEEGKPNQECVM